MSRIVVVGGGVSGLVVAHEIKQQARRSGADTEVLCFEAGARPGGSVQTVCRDGFLLESGPSGFRDSGGLDKLIRRLKLKPAWGRADYFQPISSPSLAAAASKLVSSGINGFP